ncbi:prepilin-type N-terminal cleavage/methylation domain-containing protein, partial [Candidatus Saccharibacteria bacterium]|nr:prepilin-type N-terminal cleavage/methylation domain-containing protein [Candidatus Saccharibacteria bacterium]
MKKGFTLLEVVLVVAISTLLFMSVTIGIGSRISSGRYETASTEIVDYLRDVY